MCHTIFTKQANDLHSFNMTVDMQLARRWRPFLCDLHDNYLLAENRPAAIEFGKITSVSFSAWIIVTRVRQYGYR